MQHKDEKMKYSGVDKRGPSSNSGFSSEAVAYSRAMAAGQPDFRESTIESAHKRFMAEKQFVKPEKGYIGKLRVRS